MKNAILFLNGLPPTIFPDCQPYHIRACTDGAYNYIKNTECRPDYVTGDGDSFTESHQLPPTITFIHTPDQNKTDFQKALEFLICKECTKIDIYGGSGKEQDHFLGNISVAARFYQTTRLTFFDSFGRYFFIPYHCEIRKVYGKTISLYPFPSARQIRTDGLQYPLYEEDLDLIQRTGLRNKAVKDTIRITFTSGHLLLFINEAT